MSHEAWREQLALRQYGELDEREARALDVHLESCAACREFAAELELGLGRLAQAAPPHVDEVWLARVRAGVAPRIARRRNWGWAGFAAGLAAGALLVLWLNPGQRDADTRSASLERSGPPPLARAGGEFAQLGRLWKR